MVKIRGNFSTANEFAKGFGEAYINSLKQQQLSQRLQQVGQQQNLSPFQQFAQLAGVPGITPQMLQSGSELLRQQGMRNSIKSAVGQGRQSESRGGPRDIGSISPQAPIAGASSTGMPMTPVQQEAQQPGMSSQLAPQPQGMRNQQGIPTQPQIVQHNPLSSGMEIRGPWSEQRKLEELDKLADQFPGATDAELLQMAKDNEVRDLARPEAARKEDERRRAVQENIKTKFNDSLKLKLQKTGKDETTFKDTIGEMQSNLIRGIERDIASNPNLSEDDIINHWTNKALDLAKTKTQLKTFSDKANSWFSSPSLLINKNDNRRKLDEYSDIFRNSNSSEEYYNLLREDLDLSPSGAATIAYPLNKNVSAYILKAPKGKPGDAEHMRSNSRKIATDVEKMIGPEDSLLTIGRALMFNDQYFNVRDFYDQLSEDKDRLGLTERQRRELAEGAQWGPNWNDIYYLPVFRWAE